MWKQELCKASPRWSRLARAMRMHRHQLSCHSRLSKHSITKCEQGTLPLQPFSTRLIPPSAGHSEKPSEHSCAENTTQTLPGQHVCNLSEALFLKTVFSLPCRAKRSYQGVWCDLPKALLLHQRPNMNEGSETQVSLSVIKFQSSEARIQFSMSTVLRSRGKKK